MPANANNYQITSWCRRLISDHVHPGAFCIDATMGNGNDTELLCRLAGPSSSVLAFDIQPEAIAHTNARLEAAFPDGPRNDRLILDSHARLADYASPESADCIVFNLGYLPGGDHHIATKTQTTLRALEQSLTLLKKGGLLSVCIYSGGDTGFEEKDAVLDWLSRLDPRCYLVLVTQYYNRPNNPPIPAAVIRL